MKSLYCLFVLFIFLSNNAVTAQQLDSLFYGDTANTLSNPFGAGFIVGTNSYGDIGKYQRFHITKDITLKSTRLYFSFVEIVGDADDMDIVVRATLEDGSPGDILTAKSIKTSDIVAGTSGYVVNFDTELAIEGSKEANQYFFIGFEWAVGADDSFALYSDNDGEGEEQNRVWERFNDFSFNDFGTTLNPTFSWDIDIDLWIVAFYSDGLPSSVEEIHQTPNRNFTLHQNYPNPFNPSTSIRFDLTKSDFVQLEILNVLGQVVSTPVSKSHSAGSYTVNIQASTWASGLYYYRLKVGNHSETKAFTLLK